MKHEDVKKILLENQAFKQLYEDTDLAYQVSKMIAKARIDKGLTQEQLAVKIGTKQPSIARIENYSNLPSLTMLQKIAEALDCKLEAPKLISNMNLAETQSYKIVNKIKGIFKVKEFRLEGAPNAKACMVNH